MDSSSTDVIPPYRWNGETDCLVGPFGSHKVALFFAENLAADLAEPLGQAQLVSFDGAWYLEVRASPEQPSQTERQRQR